MKLRVLFEIRYGISCIRNDFIEFLRISSKSEVESTNENNSVQHSCFWIKFLLIDKQILFLVSYFKYEFFSCFFRLCVERARASEISKISQNEWSFSSTTTITTRFFIDMKSWWLWSVMHNQHIRTHNVF